MVSSFFQSCLIKYDCPMYMEILVILHTLDILLKTYKIYKQEVTFKEITFESSKNWRDRVVLSGVPK